MRDALEEIKMPLNKKQVSWISKKNKRRFLVNVVKYFLKTFNIEKTFFAIQQTKFRFSDAIQGFFH